MADDIIEEEKEKISGSSTPLIPMVYGTLGADGQPVNIELDGADLIPVQRIQLAQLLNHVESAFRKGLFNDQPMETVAAISSNLVQLKASSVAPLDEKSTPE